MTDMAKKKSGFGRTWKAKHLALEERLVTTISSVLALSYYKDNAIRTIRRVFATDRRRTK